MSKTLAVRVGVLAFAFVGGGLANAQTPTALAQNYDAAARRETPGFAGFSAPRGQQFFQSSHGGEWSCSSCHTQDPLGPGKHARTGKAIAPLAPAANAERFTDLDKAEKWFKRNCNDVVGRPCTAQEKGDVLAYLMLQKKP